MIISNQVKCTSCNDIIFSRNIHDFVTCKCGKVSTDGGMAYIRRIGNFDLMEDMSIEMDDDLCKAICDDIKESNYNELGVLCSVMRHLRGAGYDVCETMELDSIK